MSNEWAREYFSPEEIKRFESKAEKIEDDMNTYYQVSLIAPREAVINACILYREAQMGSIEGMMFCGYMLSGIIEQLLDSLLDDGIDPYSPFMED